MPQPSALFDFLAAVPLRTYRIGLDTPGVLATVPMLRGTWGAALYHLDIAAYRAVFDRGDDGTPGYLLRPAPPDPAFAPAIDWFLIGPIALEHELALRRAWDVASGMGLGPNRIRFRAHTWRELRPDDRTGPWTLDRADWPLVGPPARTPCRLSAVSPLRILRDKNLLNQPTLTDLVVSTTRRVGAFLPAAALADWRTLSRQLIEIARRTPALPWNGDRLDLHRYSGRQQREMDLRGVVGWLDLPEGPGALWPLLAVLPWLHTGKGTIFGLGEVRIEPGGTVGA
jgi:hypothetical protein